MLHCASVSTTLAGSSHTTSCDSVAVAETPVSADGAKARQISAVPLRLLVLTTSTHVNRATLVSVKADFLWLGKEISGIPADAHREIAARAVRESPYLWGDRRARFATGDSQSTLRRSRGPLTSSRLCKRGAPGGHIPGGFGATLSTSQDARRKGSREAVLHRQMAAWPAARGRGSSSTTGGRPPSLLSSVVSCRATFNKGSDHLPCC